MRRDLAIALVMTVSLAAVQARAQASYPCDNTAPNPYKLVSYDWGQGIQPWGGVRAVAVDSHDNLWVFSRCGDGDVHGDIPQSCTGTKHAPVYELGPDGKMITHFGAGLFSSGHGIGVDGDGNVWVADGLHVFKVSPDGKLLLTLGNGKKEVGDDTFNSATGVAFLSNGDVVISEGHGGDLPQARINIFTRDGKRVRSIGTYGTGPGQNLAIHDVATDSQDHIYAASEKRSGKQPGGGVVNVYDKDGKFLAAWTQFGNPVGLYVDKRTDTLYVIDSKSVPDTKSRLFYGDYSDLYNGGCVMGIRIGSVKDGRVKYYIPPPPVLDEKYKWLPPEGITVDSHGAIYTGAEQQRTVMKYVLK